MVSLVPSVGCHSDINSSLAEKNAKLASEGARVAQSPEDVARQAHIIVLMVDTAPQVDAHHPESDEAYGVVSIRLIHRSLHRQARIDEPSQSACHVSNSSLRIAQSVMNSHG